MANGDTVNPAQANITARNILLENCIDMWQEIFSTTFTDPRGEILNVPVRNVGLIKRFVIEIEFTFGRAATGDAANYSLTEIGLANTLSNVIFTDLSNQTRVNTSGWHLHMLATARRQMAFGAAFTNDAPIGIASNYAVISGGAVNSATATKVRMFYEIPVAYGDYDLRGAIYANVVNATMNLQFTVNQNFCNASGENDTLAAYDSSTATNTGTITDCTIKVYQNYLDQLPMTDKGPILPILDLSTAYLLNDTVATGMSEGQDFAVPYANFRNFMSTFALYDNNGAAATVLPGDEINYWSIQSANYTNIIKVDPFLSSLLTREIINDDFPAITGMTMYYFDHRRKPINTIQYGNMQLIANPSNVQSNARMLIGYESLALINMITQAGSLYNT